MMFFRRSFSRWLPAALLSLASPLGAGVLFDSGPPNGFGFYSDPGAGQILGVAFTLGSASTVRQVTWWGGGEPSGSLNGTDHFTISFYAFGGATPDTSTAFSYAVIPTRTASGSIFGTLPQYRYVASIPDTALAAATWFVSITNDLDDPDDDWAWSRTSTLAPLFRKSAPADPWTQLFFPDDRLAVILADDTGSNGSGGGSGSGNGSPVPEPASLALSALGLALLYATRPPARRSVKP